MSTCVLGSFLDAALPVAEAALSTHTYEAEAGEETDLLDEARDMLSDRASESQWLQCGQLSAVMAMLDAWCAGRIDAGDLLRCTRYPTLMQLAAVAARVGTIVCPTRETRRAVAALGGEWEARLNATSEQ